jgi:hypothetical protein
MYNLRQSKEWGAYDTRSDRIARFKITLLVNFPSIISQLFFPVSVSSGDRRDKSGGYYPRLRYEYG